MKKFLLLIFLSLGLPLTQPVLSRDNGGALWVEPRVYPGAAHQDFGRRLPPPGLKFPGSLGQGIRIDLAGVSSPKAHAQPNSEGPGPTPIGFARSVKSLSTPEQVHSGLSWSRAQGGSFIGHLSIQSQGAAALRVGIRIDRLPPETEFRFHDATLQQVDLVRASEISETLQRNKASGDRSPEAEVYWSPVIEGDLIGLEVFLPPGTLPEEIGFAIDSISHLTLNPAQSKIGTMQPYSAGACNLDSRCYTSWSPTENAVARITFTSAGASYLCTGTLLNDTSSSNTPYFLTANHCISSQTIASTITSYWFYYASSCNSGTRYSGMTSVSGGGTLLYNSGSNDSAFLKLNGRLPAGVTFSGWTNSTPDLGTSSTGIHNPTGDLQKISFGSTTEYDICSPSGSNFSCNISSKSNATFIDVRFSSGTTEGGSSGSGIFLDGNRYLFGQLYGGDSGCSYQSGDNYYGLFSKTYSSGNLGQWLSSGKQGQTITLMAPPSLPVNGSATITANASSGLAVTLDTATPSICSLTGQTVTGLSTGTCSITATQAGNTTYYSATESTTIEINRADQTIQISAPPWIVVTGSASISAIASSGLPVALSATPTGTCILTGTTLHGVSAGTCQITSTQSGNDTYSSATQTATVSIIKVNQSVTVTAPETMMANGSIPVTATATSGLPVQLSSLTPSTCVIKGTLLVGVSSGSCIIKGTQSGNYAYNAATADTTISLLKGDQTLTFSLPPSIVWGDSEHLAAISSAGLPVSVFSTTPDICMVSDNQVLGLNPGVCGLLANQSGNGQFNGVTAQAESLVTEPAYPKPWSKVTIKVQGPGRVNSLPVGIDCGPYCTENFTRNTVLILEAVPDPGTSFVRWTGGCSGKLRTCRLRLNQAKQVGAVFR